MILEYHLLLPSFLSDCEMRSILITMECASCGFKDNIRIVTIELSNFLAGKAICARCNKVYETPDLLLEIESMDSERGASS